MKKSIMLIALISSLVIILTACQQSSPTAVAEESPVELKGISLTATTSPWRLTTPSRQSR